MFNLAVQEEQGDVNRPVCDMVMIKPFAATTWKLSEGMNVRTLTLLPSLNLSSEVVVRKETWITIYCNLRRLIATMPHFICVSCDTIRQREAQHNTEWIGITYQSLYRGNVSSHFTSLHLRCDPHMPGKQARQALCPTNFLLPSTPLLLLAGNVVAWVLHKRLTKKKKKKLCGTWCTCN